MDFGGGGAGGCRPQAGEVESDASELHRRTHHTLPGPHWDTVFASRNVAGVGSPRDEPRREGGSNSPFLPPVSPRRFDKLTLLVNLLFNALGEYSGVTLQHTASSSHVCS